MVEIRKDLSGQEDSYRVNRNDDCDTPSKVELSNNDVRYEGENENK